MIWTGLALAGLAFLGAAPLVRERLKPAMDDTARARAPGRIADLPQGRTHYRWLGAREGPVAVCVHGLTTPAFVWQGLAGGLGRMGFRVLVYDLYGRGFSDAPAGPQTPGFFIAQLEALLAHERVEGAVTLLGYSMGGAVAAAFAARHPARVARLVLIAPAGMGHDLGPLVRLVRRSGAPGSWLMLALYPRVFRRGTEAERGLPTSVPGIVDLQQAQLRRRGFVPAVLASLRGMLGADLQTAHMQIARQGVPVLAVWGRADTVIALRCRDRLAAWNPAARQAVIDGAGHGLTYTHAPQVLAALQAEIDIPIPHGGPLGAAGTGVFQER